MRHRFLSTLLLPAAIALAATAALGQDERFRQKPPAPDPRPELRLPRLESATLTNGLPVTVVFRDPAPVACLHLIISAGEQASPDKSPGLASLASGILSQGTQLHSAAEMEERIERIGGSFVATASRDVILIGFYFLEENLDEALDILAEMIVLPRTAEREIKIVQSMISAELTVQERSPVFAANRLMAGLLFKGHPYEKYAFSRSAIRTWTPRDLQDFWDRNIRPNNSQIVLTGAVNINVATRKISHAFVSWQPRDVTRTPLPPPKAPERNRICFIDLPQAGQCAISAGTVLPPLGPSERFALAVLSQLLGGSLNSRLFLNLRESKGYAYETGSSPEFYRAGGVFTVRAIVGPEYTAASVREMLNEIRTITREPVPPEQIDAAKAVLLGSFPLQLDRFDHLSDYVASMKATGAGDEVWTRYPENIIAVDASAILQAAQKYLTQPLIVVIAGSRELCREALAEFDEVEMYDARGQYIETIKK